MQNTVTNCSFYLYNATRSAHPAAFATPDDDNSHTHVSLTYSFFDANETVLGFISAAPRIMTTGLKSPHINYYLLRKHQGKGYATPMISGFVEYLKTLEGMALPQITLPNSSGCLEILRDTLSEERHLPQNTALLAISSYSLTVGPIFAEIPLMHSPSFIPTNKVLNFTGQFHIIESFGSFISSEMNVVKKEEERAIETLLIFSSEQPDESNFSDLRKKLIILFTSYCSATREDRPDLYPTLRDTVFAVVDEDALTKK